MKKQATISCDFWVDRQSYHKPESYQGRLTYQPEELWFWHHLKDVLQARSYEAEDVRRAIPINMPCT